MKSFLHLYIYFKQWHIQKKIVHILICNILKDL
jgi:hypothetical protein